MLSEVQPASGAAWDSLAREELLKWDADSDKRPRVFYLTEAYVCLVEEVLKYFPGRKVALLKTDLWNEAFGPGKTILGRLRFPGLTAALCGVDVSAAICQRVREISPDIKAALGDIRALPFSGNSFDLVLDLSTLDHISESEVPLAIREYHRVLSPGGVLVLVYWRNDWLIRLVNFLTTKIWRRPLIDNRTQFAFTDKFIAEALKGKFQIERQTALGLILLLLLDLKKLAPLLERVPPRWYQRWARFELNLVAHIFPGRLGVFIGRKVGEN